MRCDECKYWQPEPEGYRMIRDVGLCSKAVQLWAATEWVLTEGDDAYCDRVVKPELIGQMSFVQDGSDYHADLWTKAQFFCAHFENT